ncbi:hypothetical protein O3P69_007421 [Scylla paramamosain]|uniref:WAP domain-containing protein n=1 Tax=Scylla paramamosain TaxID=85552 RepID=A0AAW0V7K6_SCYPA
MKSLLPSLVFLVICTRLQVAALLRDEQRNEAKDEEGIEPKDKRTEAVQTFRRDCRNYYFNNMECDTFQFSCMNHTDCPRDLLCCLTDWCIRECVSVLSVMPFTDQYVHDQQVSRPKFDYPWLVFGLMRRLPMIPEDEFFEHH